jgi:hypothetical protein
MLFKEFANELTLLTASIAGRLDELFLNEYQPGTPT